MGRAPPCNRDRPALAWVILYAAVALFASAHPASAEAFLERGLPLSLLLTTPSELLSANTSGALTGRTPLTAVFSRTVVALGSDFGKAALPASMVPFNLSCGVPGLSRWVTTTIYRFDPAVDWPTDLDCPFTWNAGLKTFDGVPLKLPPGAPPSVRLVSPPVAFTISDVASERAQNVTDSQWNAYRGMADDKFPEVPPDANVTLTFTYPVTPADVQAALRVESCCNRTDGAGRELLALPCGPPFVVADPFAAASGAAEQDPMRRNSTCVVIRIEPGLGAGEVVTVRLPKGARYSPFANATKDSEVYLWGLRRFRVPLRDNFQQLKGRDDSFGDDDNGISYRRMSMWLPHGLAPDAQISDLAGQMDLCKYKDPYDWSSPCEPVKFDLDRFDRGRLVMSVPSFWPRDHYKLTIRGSDKIKDAYGLPLEPSQAYFFTTSPAPGLSGPALATGTNLMVLEPSSDPAAPLQWPVASRGAPKWDSDAAGVAAWPVEPGAFAAAVNLTSSFDDNWPAAKALGLPKTSMKRNEGPAGGIDVLQLSGAPGLQLVAQSLKGTPRAGNPTFLAQTNLQFASVTVDKKMIAWVTDARGAPPPAVVGADVALFIASYGQGVAKVGSCTTNANGTCTVDLEQALKGRGGQLSALVTAKDHGPLAVSAIDAPYIPSDADSGAAAEARKWAGVLALDRALVQPGDTLHVVGYLQARNGSRLSLPPPGTPATLLVSPAWNQSQSGPDSRARIPVKLTDDYGSFRANVSVPRTAGLLQYEVALVVGNGTANLASEAFTVADPRPPTAVLNVTVPDWSMPNSTVKALVSIASYLGADVSGATVKLTWTVPLAKGEVNVTTDARGRAVALIPLGELPAANATKIGDSLELRSEWVGPTGEPYLQSNTVRLEEGPVSATLSLSPQTDAPGVPFIVSAATFLNDEARTPLEGVVVEVSLAPANATSLANCSAEARAAVAAQRCTVASGRAAVGADGGACALTLPCEADLLLRACPVAFANGTRIAGGGAPPCSETPVGRNGSAWADAPWAAQPTLRLLPDRANYTLGSTAVLSFSVPPYTGETAGLLVWGNGDAQRSRPLSGLRPGANRVELGPLGDECRGGCRAALVLAAGRPRGDAAAAAAAAALPRVARSKLFDPLGPHTLSHQIELRVLPPSALNVSVSVAAPGGLRARDGSNASIVPPLSGAAVQVDVVDGGTGEPMADAEVTVVMVDRAMLDLMPYELKDLSAGVIPPLDLYLSIKDINQNRASRAAINATFAALARRLAADPWLPLDTTVTPSQVYDQDPAWGSSSYVPAGNPVDVPDSDYLKRYSSPVTVTPFYTWGITQRYPAASRKMADASAALRISDEFAAVPLFAAAKTDASGRATLPFKAPPNLGRFAVRAFAVSKGKKGAASSYGANETEAVVRLPVSLTPALPRIVRVGDDFEAGVLVSAPDAGAEALPVTVRATLVEPPSLKAAAKAAPTNGTAAAATPANGTAPAAVSLANGSAPTAAAPANGAAAPANGAAPSISMAAPPPATAPAIAPAVGGRSLLADTLGAEAAGGEAAADGGAPAGVDPPQASVVLLRGAPSERATALTGARQQREVRFPLSAARVGAAAVRFDLFIGDAQSGGSPVDSAVYEFPVLGRQAPVFLATSFALNPGAGPNGSGAGQVEGLALPEADPGSGSVDVFAGVGNLPFLQTSYESVTSRLEAAADGDDTAGPASAPDLLAAAVLPALLARYSLGNRTAAAPSPRQLATSRWAVSKLAGGYTDKDLGLQYSDYSKLPPDWRPSSAAVQLNGWAAWLLDQAAAPLKPQPGDKAAAEALDLLKPLQSAAPTWRKALASQVTRDAARARKSGPDYDALNNAQSGRAPGQSGEAYSDWDEMSWARLALGAGWKPDGELAKAEGVPADSLSNDLSIARLATAAKSPGNTTVGAAARAGLALLAAKDVGSARDAAALSRALQSQLRVQGRTAYVAAAPGSASAAGAEDQAFALMLLAATLPADGASGSLVQKLSAGVARGARPGLAPLGAGPAGGPAATAAAALAAYDSSRGSAAPDASVAVAAVSGPVAAAAQAGNGTVPVLLSSVKAGDQAGGKLLLEADFGPKGPGAATAASSTPWAALPPNATALAVGASGRGEVSVAAGLTFTPARLLDFPTYRGLWVQRVVQSEAGGGNLAAADASRLVTVTVQITTPDDLGEVVVEVLMPGGLEPLDPAVYKDPSAALTCDLGGGGGGGGGGGSGGRWWWLCPQTAVTPSAVTVRYGSLGAGATSFSFKAAAATPGTYALPPVKAYAVAQPEVMGLSAAGSFTVCPARPPAAGAGGVPLVTDPGFGADAASDAAARFASDGGEGPDAAAAGPPPAVCVDAAAAERPPLAAAKACPADCSGNGVCNLSSGACICNVGFLGADCSQAAVF
ncbi:hypothetical protein Rsub_08870 [Raphidocelis subcapitata]|uniref:EGF-like domain-containing protein n=1 Tax=Raphidocelis subcapitata TaxID=307507 RepID=A0A2V0PB09_9CHLO|nr:hypothetical protein Rsub_08870 [Raphidocelis subcapitata]|eukprot:GBF96122.1 hypothetical protein Rsub_08870 [Raphidocelis subcapitata]